MKLPKNLFTVRYLQHASRYILMDIFGRTVMTQDYPSLRDIRTERESQAMVTVANIVAEHINSDGFQQRLRQAQCIEEAVDRIDECFESQRPKIYDDPVKWPEWMGEFPRHGAPWNRLEEWGLVRFWRDGKTISELARHHGRYECAISIRLAKLLGENYERHHGIDKKAPGDLQVKVTAPVPLRPGHYNAKVNSVSDKKIDVSVMPADMFAEEHSELTSLRATMTGLIEQLQKALGVMARL